MALRSLSLAVVGACFATFLLSFITIRTPTIISLSDAQAYIGLGASLVVGIFAMSYVAWDIMGTDNNRGGMSDETNPDIEEAGKSGTDKNKDTVKRVIDDDLVEALFDENLEQMDEDEMGKSELQELMAHKMELAVEIREEIKENNQ
jgi:hypothetical protein